MKIYSFSQRKSVCANASQELWILTVVAAQRGWKTSMGSSSSMLAKWHDMLISAILLPCRVIESLSLSACTLSNTLACGFAASKKSKRILASNPSLAFQYGTAIRVATCVQMALVTE